MAKVISDILGANTVEFNHLIEKWELKTGRKSHDISLASDIRHRSLNALKELNLDPNDTANRELYFALQERAKTDNLWLSDLVGVTNHDTPTEVTDKVLSWIKNNSKYLSVWSLKTSVLKSFLTKQIPKATMKAVGARSIDSMLKRNSPAEILILANELEKPEWYEKFISNYKKISPSDFDVKKIDFFVTSNERSEKISKAGFNESQFVTRNFESGSLFLKPQKYRYPLDVLAMVLAISESIYDLRKHSALYRTFSVRADFGTQVFNIARHGVTTASLKVSDIGWNSLHRHLVGNEMAFSDFEQPYLTSDDLKAESSIDALSRIDPRFQYWKNLEFTFFTSPGSEPVSLNLVDVVTSASNRLEHGRGSRHYGQMKLWEELWARYLTSDHVVEDVINGYLRN